MNDQMGFFYPGAATGRYSLIPSLAWHYSGDMRTVEYRTGPVRVSPRQAEGGQVLSTAQGGDWEFRGICKPDLSNTH